jgi:hypothetical protein
MGSNKQIFIDVHIDETVNTSISISSLARRLDLDDIIHILKAKDYNLNDCFKLIIEHAESNDEATKSFIMTQNLTIIQADKLNEFLKTIKA